MLRLLRFPSFCPGPPIPTDSAAKLVPLRCKGEKRPIWPSKIGNPLEIHSLSITLSLRNRIALAPVHHLSSRSRCRMLSGRGITFRFLFGRGGGWVLGLVFVQLFGQLLALRLILWRVFQQAVCRGPLIPPAPSKSIILIMRGRNLRRSGQCLMTEI